MSNNTKRRRYAFNENNTINNTTNIISNINKGIKNVYNNTKKNNKIKTHIKKNIYSKLNFKTRFIDFGLVYSNDLAIIGLKNYKHNYFIWPFETRFMYETNFELFTPTILYNKYNSFQDMLYEYYIMGRHDNKYNINNYYNIISVIYDGYDIYIDKIYKKYKKITDKVNSIYIEPNERKLFYAKVTDVYSLGIALAGKYASITNHILDLDWDIVNNNKFKNKIDKKANKLFLKQITIPFYNLIYNMVYINPLKRINISEAKHKFIEIISGLTNDESRNNLRQRGGIKIGEGGYGCVYRPQIPCDGKTVQPGYVSKVINKNDAIIELNESIKIKKIDPQNKFFVYPVKMCNIIPEVINNIKDCRMYSSNAVLLQLPDGGQTLQDIRINNNEIIDFIRSWLSLFYGLELLHNNNMAHMDIKTINIVSKLETKNSGISNSYGFSDETNLSTEAYAQLNILMKTPSQIIKNISNSDNINE